MQAYDRWSQPHACVDPMYAASLCSCPVSEDAAHSHTVTRLYACACVCVYLRSCVKCGNCTEHTGPAPVWPLRAAGHGPSGVVLIGRDTSRNKAVSELCAGALPSDHAVSDAGIFSWRIRIVCGRLRRDLVLLACACPSHACAHGALLRHARCCWLIHLPSQPAILRMSSDSNHQLCSRRPPLWRL